MNRYIVGDMAEITNKEFHWIKMIITNIDMIDVRIQVRLPSPITPKHINWEWLFYEGYVSDEEWFELCYFHFYETQPYSNIGYTFEEIKELIGFQKQVDDWEKEVRQRAIEIVGEDASEFELENVMDFTRPPLLLKNFPIDKPTRVPKSGIKVKRKKFLFKYGYIYKLCGDGVNEKWNYRCVFT